MKTTSDTSQKDSSDLTQKLKQLEARISMQGALINELEFEINSMQFNPYLDDILSQVSDACKKVKSVREIHYAPLKNSVLEIIILYGSKNRTKSLKTACKKLSSVESAFPGTRLEITLQHRDKIQQDYLVGTKPVFVS